MHEPHFFMSPTYRRAVAGLLDGVLGSFGSVVLSGAAGAGKTVVLNAAAADLAAGSGRVIRVAASATGPLELRDFIAQVAGLPGVKSLTEEAVGQAFEALTTTGGKRARIVLIVDGAEALALETLRYIQLACKLQPLLQVVLSGRPEFEDHLKDGEFSFLRGRLARTLTLPALSDEEAAAFIRHRLRAAEPAGKQAFNDHAFEGLLRHGLGNPGRISAVLDQALAAQQRGRHDMGSATGPGEPTWTVGDKARAGPADAAPTRRSDDRPAAPMRSDGGRNARVQSVSGRSAGQRRPMWVSVMMGLIGGFGLSAALLAATAPKQRVQPLTIREHPMAAPLPPHQLASPISTVNRDQTAVENAGPVSALLAGDLPNTVTERAQPP